MQAHITEICNNRLNFQKLGQTFVEMSEAPANVLHVTAAAQRMFGEDYVVVTADGLEVKDGPGTQGLKSWKVNSRKFFAVPEDDLLAPTRKRSRRRVDASARAL